jgi:D-alanine-D-alanine ligase
MLTLTFRRNREITPADLTPAQTSAAQAVALMAHQAIGCFGYTRTDMIMTPSGIYYLETNTLPGMTKASFIPQQLRAAAIDLQDFVEEQINLASKRFQ